MKRIIEGLGLGKSVSTLIRQAQSKPLSHRRTVRLVRQILLTLLARKTLLTRQALLPEQKLLTDRELVPERG
jgi:hypothetical protein